MGNATIEGFIARMKFVLFFTFFRGVAFGDKANTGNLITDWFHPTTGIISTVNVHTLRWIRGTSNPASTSRIQVLKLRLDFWRHLASEAEEEEVMGSLPPGIAQEDFDRWGDPDYWKNVWGSDPALLYGTLGIDLEQGAPEFFVERNGMLVHWQIIVGLKLVP